MSQPTDTGDPQRRKRLGQYFTGTGLGRLLAALAGADKAKSIVDPMAGSGDLLASCVELGAKPLVMAGIEIDPVQRTACQRRLPLATCLLGSAFDSIVLSRLPTRSWDLVIANPPYVRYQSIAREVHSKDAPPSAAQVRSALLNSLPLLAALDDEDRRLYAKMVSGYSGLSDLAVPSWILCSGLVALGGRMALVVPESWLSRDYATIVSYLLLRWFDIEFVIEDEHASWFDDAQIKTTLIIAKRVTRRATAQSRPEGAHYCHVAIDAAAASAGSPIGRLDLPRTQDEKGFAQQARLWLRNGTRHDTGLARARPVSLSLVCRNVLAAASRQKWFDRIECDEGKASAAAHVPVEIHDWLSRHGLSFAFETFESQGIAVGQGLRTGANGFFYATGERHGQEVTLTFSGPLLGLTITAPLTIAKPVLRRQSELPRSFAVSPAITSAYALDLRWHALPEDMRDGDLIATHYSPMPSGVAALVRAAAKANFGTAGTPQKVFELTAVSPNIRAASDGAPARYWYMLPDFAPRHLPDVLIARVNSTTPKAYINLGRQCLIDANFSTMWTRERSRWTANALLAFMNSAWAQAVIEFSGAVMGGGALKVEATHLRRIPVPTLGEYQLRLLDRLGVRLVGDEAAAEVTREIDAVLANSLGCNEDGTTGLRRIAHLGQARRAKHKKRR